MKEKKMDYILNIIEGIVCFFGIIVFSIASVEVMEMQRYLFIVADIYCAFKLTSCVEGIRAYLKDKKNYSYDKQIDQVINLS